MTRRPLATAAGFGAGAALAAWTVALMNASGDLAVPGVLRIAAANAFLLEVGCAIVAAPLAGAATRGRCGRALLAVGAFTLVSLCATTGAAFLTGYPRASIVGGHLALAAVALALTMFGAALGARMNNVLDAAGLALTASLVAATALLVAGPWTDTLPETAINAGLVANPLIAATSAAQMDLLRGEILYQLAPVSHRRFTYPAWQMTTVAYGTAAVFWAALTSKGSRA